MRYSLNARQQPISIRVCGLIGMLFSFYLIPTVVGAEHFPLHISSQPFSSSMCKKIDPLEDVRIKIANHRDLVIRAVEDQFIPADREEARKKSYVHAVTLQDLSDGNIMTGAIAFTTDHAIIFTSEFPQGISRKAFLNQWEGEHQKLASQALDTFLRLHKVFNAALDACRPYPSKVTYGTDDEIDKIQAGRLRYRNLTKTYNAQQRSYINFPRHEAGKSGGFVDPRFNRKNVSYHAINPLVFYRP